MIAAMSDSDQGIGSHNQLLWHIPEDLSHFKKVTLGHPVIMGSKTFRSIGRALPGRKNIVLTLQEGENFEGATVCHDVQEALDIAAAHDQEEIFVIGGATIYKTLLPYADRLYLTLVPGDYEADTFFPDYSDFSRVVSEESAQTKVGLITFLTLERE